MTPTEQDNELREKLLNLRITVWKQTNLNGQANLDHDSVNEILQLITADRKRVALEARRNEALIADRNLGQYPDYHKMKTASLKRIDDIERGLFISVHELKAQQEEV